MSFFFWKSRNKFQILEALLKGFCELFKSRILGNFFEIRKWNGIATIFLPALLIGKNSSFNTYFSIYFVLHWLGSNNYFLYKTLKTVVCTCRNYNLQFLDFTVVPNLNSCHSNKVNPALVFLEQEINKIVSLRSRRNWGRGRGRGRGGKKNWEDWRESPIFSHFFLHSTPPPPQLCMLYILTK